MKTPELMSYCTTHSSHEGIATFRLSGAKTIEAAIDFWSNLHEQIEQRNLDCALVIDEMEDQMTVWDVVDVEAYLSASGFPRRVRLAIVDADLQQAGNSNAFCELYMLNRGWLRIRPFETLESAMQWLHSREDEVRGRRTNDNR